MSPRTDPVDQRFGPSCLPHCPSSDQPLAVEGFKVYDDSGLPSSMRPGSACVASTHGPRTPLQASEASLFRSTPPCRLVSDQILLRPEEAEVGHAASQGPAFGLPLVSSALPLRSGAPDARTPFFWSCWRPASRHSTTRHEVVVPTPHGPTVQPEPNRERECWDAVPLSGVPMMPPPKGADQRPGASGNRRRRRHRPVAATVPQLIDLASLLRCKSADDPNLHSLRGMGSNPRVTGGSVGKPARLASPGTLFWHPRTARPSDPCCFR